MVQLSELFERVQAGQIAFQRTHYNIFLGPPVGPAGPSGDAEPVLLDVHRLQAEEPGCIYFYFYIELDIC